MTLQNSPTNKLTCFCLLSSLSEELGYLFYQRMVLNLGIFSAGKMQEQTYFISIDIMHPLFLSQIREGQSYSVTGLRDSVRRS